MFPIRRSFSTVIGRLEKLANTKSEHDFAKYESFAATYCVTEKLIRRVLIDLMEKAGKSPKLIKQQTRGGYRALKKQWPNYDKGRELVSVIGMEVEETVSDATDVRDELLHGENDPGVARCQALTHKLIAHISVLHATFSTEFGFSGWKHKTRQIKTSGQANAE